MPKTVNQYATEQQEVLTKLLNILEISDTNKTFSLRELDNNLIKQQNIINLETDIKKYFIFSHWTYFRNKDREMKRNYLSLIKSLLRFFNIQITALHKKNRFDKTNKNETIYIIDYK